MNVNKVKYFFYHGHIVKQLIYDVFHLVEISQNEIKLNVNISKKNVKRITNLPSLFAAISLLFSPSISSSVSLIDFDLQ